MIGSRAMLLRPGATRKPRRELGAQQGLPQAEGGQDEALKRNRGLSWMLPQRVTAGTR